MNKYKIETTATWETEVEAETKEEALELFDPEDYENYISDWDVELIEEDIDE